MFGGAQRDFKIAISIHSAKFARVSKDNFAQFLAQTRIVLGEAAEWEKQKQLFNCYHIILALGRAWALVSRPGWSSFHVLDHWNEL